MKSAVIITGILLLTASLALSGCSVSEGITTAPTAATDTAPPAVPTGLAAAAGRATVELDWHANTADHDFLGFLVYRLAFGQAWPLTDTPVQLIHFTDHAPLRGGATYGVTSVDLSGNESAWATVRYNYPPDYPDITNP